MITLFFFGGFAREDRSPLRFFLSLNLNHGRTNHNTFSLSKTSFFNERDETSHMF